MQIRINRNLVLKIVLFLYFLYYILSYHNGVWEFGGDKYGMMPIYTNMVNIIRLFYLISLLALGLYEMVIQIKKMPQIDRGLMVIFFTISLWKLIEVSKFIDTQTLLFQAGTPMMYVVFLAFFIGMDDKVETDLLILSKRYGFIYLCLTVLYFLGFCFNVGYSFGIRFESSPILYSFNNGLFLLIYGLYNDTTHKGNITWKILLLLLAFGAFITTSRGWILQTLVIIMMYFVLQNRGKRVVQNIVKAVFAIATLVILFNFVSPEILNSMLARVGQSTRSSQLEQFFSQIRLGSLVRGLGYNASYVFLHWKNYQFIDNQIIFSAFRYGITIIGIQTYFLLKPLFMSIPLGQEVRTRSVGVIHFVLAMLGISIYFALSIDIDCIIAYALAGRAYMNAKKTSTI